MAPHPSEVLSPRHVNSTFDSNGRPVPETEKNCPPKMPPTTQLVPGRSLSTEGALRKQGTLRSLVSQFSGRDDIISLSGGLPHPSVLPFNSITAELNDGTVVSLNGPLITAAQQYNTSLRGFPPLLQWAQAHVQALHAPPLYPSKSTMTTTTANNNKNTTAVAITNGGNHTIEIATSLLLNHGDSFIIEEYTYPIILESVSEPKGLKPIGTDIDQYGIIPEKLEAVLADLLRKKSQQQAAGSNESQSLSFPKLLYTIPTGQNPTGSTCTLERKRAIYDICRKYDLWIIEDDPYFYLQYGTNSKVPGLNGLIAQGPQSYLSLDIDGRVIRIDSFAKFLAPGLRLGWVTGPEMIVEKIVATIQAHTVGPCGITQVLAASTLGTWGDAGLHDHLTKVQGEYGRRARMVGEAAERYLTGLAEWGGVPQAGMFLWIKLLFPKGSTTTTTIIRDAYDIWGDFLEAGVVFVPGRATHWRGGAAAGGDASFYSPYIRVSFSNASDECIEEGMKRLRHVLLKIRE